MKGDDFILESLRYLYGEERGVRTTNELQALLDSWKTRLTGAAQHPRSRLTHQDALMITYGDQVREAGVPPLQSLAGFCRRYLMGLVNGIHILPFYPYSSDDGFSVIDYKAVNPELGNWEDIRRLSADFRLMFDAVINHVSARSAWFQSFLQDDPRFKDYFIVVPEGKDLTQVVRPRALPLLTEFETPSGPKAVWTTFSADQIDLNFKNPQVLLDILDVLLHYIAQGADLLRLDAIAFLWKEYGTTCLHLPQTHRIIQLIRRVTEEVAPGVLLITETNVPHHDNVSYFGDGTNEAHLVYNFALPPLVMHSILSGDAQILARWASELRLPSDQVTFFNFLASHDGIGLNPGRGILSEAQIQYLVDTTLAHNGRVSYKNNPDGSQSPYELNINYFDALSDPQSDEPLGLQVDRFMAAQAIMLSLRGMPGIYFHSLFGSRGWPQGVDLFRHNRAINRQKLERAQVEAELRNEQHLRARVFSRYAQLLRVRNASPEFDPYGSQEVIDAGHPAVIAALRRSPTTGGRMVCLQNVAAEPARVYLDWNNILGVEPSDVFDSLTRMPLRLDGKMLRLRPYQTAWCKSRRQVGGH